MFDWFKAKSKKNERATSIEEPPRERSVGDGFEAFRNGNMGVARSIFDAILKTNPQNADALYLSGLIDNAEGMHAAASDKIARAIAVDGSTASFHVSLGTIRVEMGQHSNAIECFRSALRLDPNDPEIRGALGTSLLEVRQFVEAREHLLHAAQAGGATPLILFNLGVACQKLGQTDAARKYYELALSADPRNADAENNLGALLHACGEYSKAIACFQRSLAIRPQFALACVNLGVSLQASKRVDEALTYFQRAIVLEPRNFTAHSNCALALREQGAVEESLAASQSALAIRDDIAERMRMATLIPVIAMSANEIATWRVRFESAVKTLTVNRGAVQDPLNAIGACNFNLAYQPECDKALQQLSAQMYLANCPSLQYEAAHCRERRRAETGKLRIGFISKFMHQHSIGRTTRGLLANMNRARFEVVALFVPPLVDDTISQFIRQSADTFHVLPGSLDKARQYIAALELDVLFYQDIGMDPYSYYLAYSRLAPVQCVSFGHPDTTGIPSIDYWVSNDGFEVEDAPAHYSEKLFLLKDIGTLAYYYRPELKTALRTKERFNLDPAKNIYLCPQSLFKLHPDFDEILGGILRGDTNGLVVLVQAQSKAWTNRLVARFAVTLPDVAHRIEFVPPMSPHDFLGLIAASEVMLDTLYFNGMNTSLEALAVGTPVVTMPTQMQRGRHTYGMYKRMGYEACVANSVQQYIEIALRLANNAAHRNEVRAAILERSAVLYEDVRVVREFERFFEYALQELQSAAPAQTSAPEVEACRPLFLVTSAVHARHGIYDAQQRLEQTLATCQSIHTHCPGADIVLLDGGVAPVTEAEQAMLEGHIKSVVNFAATDYFQGIHAGLDENLLKSKAEIRMVGSYLNDLLKQSPASGLPYDRIVKLSGRYQLNADFKYLVHAQAKEKITISAARDSQYDAAIRGATSRQYMSRLWSFDISLLSQIATIFEDMESHMLQSIQSGKFVDIEHLLYAHLPKEQVVALDRIGVHGELAPSGAFVSD